MNLGQQIAARSLRHAVRFVGGMTPTFFAVILLLKTLEPAIADPKEACLAVSHKDVHFVLKYCEDFLDTKPSSLESAAAHYNRGVAYLLLGVNYLALAEFNQAISDDPSLYLPWVGRAEVYLRMQNFKLAEQDVRKALSIDPNRFDGQNIRALVAQELGETDQLLSSGDKLIQLNPNSAEGYERRGEAYANLGELDKARADFLKATLLKPNLTSAWARLGTICAMKGDTPRAFEAFDKALALDPGWIEALVNRGKLYEDKGQKEKAAADYRAALSHKSDLTRGRLLQNEALARLAATTTHVPSAELSISSDVSPQTPSLRSR